MRALFDSARKIPAAWSRMDDAALIAACLRGEARAWDALIDRCQALIFSIRLRMGLPRGDAEDVFQDVCLLLFSHLDSLRDRARLSSWLISTTRREAWRMARRRRALPEADLADPEGEMERGEHLAGAGPELPEEAVLALERQQSVREAFQKLPERCRELLERLYVRDPPEAYAEISAQMGLPMGSIGPTRARCLQRLQRLLEEAER